MDKWKSLLLLIIVVVVVADKYCFLKIDKNK